MAGPFRIALCTDTHAWRTPAPVVSPAGNLIHVDRSEELEALLLDEVRRHAPDLVLHLGDMTNGGGYFGMPAAEFAAQLARIKAAWSALPAPVHALPGNHDTALDGAALPAAGVAGSAVNGKLSGAWRPFEREWGLLPGQGRTLENEFARLVLVNTQGHSAAQVAEALPDDPVYGWVSENELERVEQSLDEAGERPVLLFMHQLMQPWGARREWRDFFAIENRDALWALIEKFGNVRAVFQGHAHFYEVQPLEVSGRTIPFVVAPAAVEAPLAWLLLTLDGAGLRVELQRLPVDLPEPEGQGRRAGPSKWQQWQMAW